MTPYSLSEHLAQSLLLSTWREGWFAVFSAYFDASGQEEDPELKTVSVAGFIAPAPVWIDFEREWTERLSRDGLTQFHMSACANYRYDFEGWRAKESKRQKLLRDLVDILKPLSRKFACSVHLDPYRENLDSSLRDKYDFKAYVIAARACAARLRTWTEQQRSPQLSRVQLFFEAGDNWQPELKDRLIADGFPEPIFLSPKEIDIQRQGS